MILVTLNFPGYWEGRQRVMADDLMRTVQLRSPYLVSAGQCIEIGVAAQVVTVPKAEPGARLFDARGLRLVAVDPTHNYEYIPSARTLWQVLEDAVQHGVEWPSHGTDCACLDKYSYELKHHILRALPERTLEAYQNSDEWAKDFNARMRVKHLLRMASNIL